MTTPGSPGNQARVADAAGRADPIGHDVIDGILAGRDHDPHSVLGAHPGPDGTVIRALRPLARAVQVLLPDGARYPMRHVHEGVFSVTLPPGAAAGEYQLVLSYAADGPELITDDPYRHLPTLGEMDLHLIGEGRHEELWRVLGARVRPELGGTSFAVWAPSARAVRVIGDFNHWDGRAHPMRSLGSSGVWELFLPRVRAGLRLGRQGLDDGQVRARSPARAHEHLRGPHRLVAARAFVCRARREPC